MHTHTALYQGFFQTLSDCSYLGEREGILRSSDTSIFSFLLAAPAKKIGGNKKIEGFLFLFFFPKRHGGNREKRRRKPGKVMDKKNLLRFLAINEGDTQKGQSRVVAVDTEDFSEL